MGHENDLSEREREILRLVATGASNKEIAQRLVISTNTVKGHLRSIFSKIGVISRTEATLFAIRNGIAPSIPEAEFLKLSAEAESPGADGKNPAGRPEPGLAVVPASPASILPEVIIPEMPARRLLSRPRGWVAAGGLVLAAILLVLAAIGVFNLLPGRAPAPTLASLQTQTPQSRWKSLPPLPEARSGLAAAIYESNIYVIGGDTTQGVTGTVESYSLDQKTWQSLAAKPAPVADVAAVVLGGLIYVPGGRLASGGATAVMEVYNPHNDTWESKASLPVAVSGYALAAFEGKLYLFGGWDGTQALSEVLVYDPEVDRWETRSPMPGPRAFAGAAVAGGKIYVMGGYDGTRALDANQAYIPERDQPGEIPWVEQARLPKARYSMGITSLADTIYLVGGKGDGSPIEYILQGNDWHSMDAPLLQVDSSQVLVSLDIYLYALGGLSGGKATGAVQAYQALYTISMPVIQ
jgi:DNA-binding CsgD family transcriptional regulator/N-acetylneuraminic acid mutarotase